MRARIAAITVGTVLTGAVLGATITAGQAAAARPIFDPQHGIVAGVALDHGETAALQNTPVPEMLDQVMPNAVYQVDPSSQLRQTNGKLYADLPAVWTEAAQAPNGRIGIAILNPSMFAGHTSAIVQALH